MKQFEGVVLGERAPNNSTLIGKQKPCPTPSFEISIRFQISPNKNNTQQPKEAKHLTEKSKKHFLKGISKELAFILTEIVQILDEHEKRLQKLEKQEPEIKQAP